MLETISKEEITNKINQCDSTSFIFGNGLSMAYGGDDFSHDGILNASPIDQDLKNLFLNTKEVSIERMINLIRSFSNYYQKIIPESSKMIADLENKNVENLKSGLINSIKEIHPEDMNQQKANNFLKNCDLFKIKNIFSTNYDLLIYWSINQSGSGKKKYQDGFGGAANHKKGINWYDPIKQNIFYLHGTIFYFDESSHNDFLLKKTDHANTYMRNLHEIEERINAEQFPLVVIEGNHDKKKELISSNKYLDHCYCKLSSLKGPLFTYGISFENDDHLLEAIDQSSIDEFLIGIYSDDSKKSISKKIAKYKNLENKLVFYNSSSLDFWSN